MDKATRAIAWTSLDSVFARKVNIPAEERRREQVAAEIFRRLTIEHMAIEKRGRRRESQSVMGSL